MQCVTVCMYGVCVTVCVYKRLCVCMHDVCVMGALLYRLLQGLSFHSSCVNVPGHTTKPC